MTWSSTWKDILKGGSGRWKIDDLSIKQTALAILEDYVSKSPLQTTTVSSSLSILCPLAGDDPFVHQAWLKGHSVTSIDLVPEAVTAMRHQFSTVDEDWKEEVQGSTTIWKHSSGRATLYVGDMMANRPELVGQFDAVYDKDSFGALDKELRQPFCSRLAEYTKDGAIVYTEVKFKDANSPGRHAGPPYHVEKDDLMEATSFGQSFTYIASLGQVYELPMPGMQQTGHILQRNPRIKEKEL